MLAFPEQHAKGRPKENQAFRAHRSARRRGLGVLLLRAAEDEARRIGRTVLTLDTETGSAAERELLERSLCSFKRPAWA